MYWGIALFSGGVLLALQNSEQMTEALGSADTAALLGLITAFASVICILEGLCFVLVRKNGHGAMWIICLILCILGAIGALSSVNLLSIALDALSLYCLFRLRK